MNYTTFLNNLQKNTAQSRLLLLDVFSNIESRFAMKLLPYKILLTMKAIDQLTFLRDRYIVADPDERRWVSPREAEELCNKAFTRDTIKKYALNRKNTEGAPLVRWQYKAEKDISPQNKKKNVQEIEVWLPDVLSHSLFIGSLEILENKTNIVNKPKIRGKYVYEYAPLRDKESMKTALENEGGMVIEILCNICKYIDENEVNVPEYREIVAELKS